MLALFEHIPTAEQPAVIEACYELLVPGGRVVITVPSPAVDPMLEFVIAKPLTVRPVHPRRPTQVDFGPVASVPVGRGTV
jgi:hypothetical protein